MNEKMNVYDLLMSFRNNLGSYHHHKEQIAYRIVLIYLLGATALVIQGESFWKKISNSFELVIIAIVIGLSALGAFKYVRWQLKNRQFASDMITACTNMAALWIIDSPDPGELKAVKIESDRWVHPESVWPKAVGDEYIRIRDLGGLQGTPRYSEYLTYGLMGLWTLAAAIPLWKVFTSWICCH